jgi:arylsulfatase A-like enzyme
MKPPLTDVPLRLYRDAEALPGEVDQRRLTEDSTREAIRFVRAARDRPFFLYLAYTMPHVPLHVSERFAGRSARGLYGDVVETIDWSVGEILRALEASGHDDDTVVLFTSDNGPWLRERENGGSAGLLREGKGTTYEGGMRVPCIVRWPGGIPAGAVRSEPVSALDVLPTLLDLAGIDAPRRVRLDGRSIAALLAGGSAPPREPFFYFQGAFLEAVRDGKWKLREALPVDSSATSSRPEAIVAALERSAAEKRALLATEVVPEAQVRPTAELYDLDVDPSERFNLAEQQPEVVARLRSVMADFARGLEPGSGFDEVRHGFVQRLERRRREESSR